jgi:hypothetical protein
LDFLSGDCGKQNEGNDRCCDHNRCCSEHSGKMCQSAVHRSFNLPQVPLPLPVAKRRLICSRESVGRIESHVHARENFIGAEIQFKSLVGNAGLVLTQKKGRACSSCWDDGTTAAAGGRRLQEKQRAASSYVVFFMSAYSFGVSFQPAFGLVYLVACCLLLASATGAAGSPLVHQPQISFPVECAAAPCLIISSSPLTPSF